MPNNFINKSLRLPYALSVIFGLILPLAGFQDGQPPAAAPESADAVFQSATASLREHKYKEAEEAFRRLSKLEPSSYRGLLGVVAVYAGQGKYDIAIQALQGQLSKDRSRPELHMAVGEIAASAAKYDLAITEFLWVLNHGDKFSPTAGNLSFRIGQLYSLKGELDFALIFLRQAKDLLPGNTAVLTALGMTLQHAGQIDAAGREYRAVLDADPDNAIALNNLAVLLSESGGDLDTALKYAKRASELQPDSPDVGDTLGWVDLKKNMTAEAVRILTGVVKKEPGRSTFRYHLALALEQQGDHAGAIQELKTALNSMPPQAEQQQIQDLLQKIGR